MRPRGAHLGGQWEGAAVTHVVVGRREGRGEVPPGDDTAGDRARRRRVGVARGRTVARRRPAARRGGHQGVRPPEGGEGRRRGEAPLVAAEVPGGPGGRPPVRREDVHGAARDARRVEEEALNGRRAWARETRGEGPSVLRTTRRGSPDRGPENVTMVRCYGSVLGKNPGDSEEDVQHP